MAKKMGGNIPGLDLAPEQQQVLSTDFNLFYKPQQEPEIAGLKEFTQSLDSFVKGAGVKSVIGAEIKQKEVNSAQAIKDYQENKLKFKEAIKEGKIDVTANPYYLEKYKELTLNDFATEFSDRVTKKYGELDVKNNITEGSFENFYKDQLKGFIKDKNLGLFQPIELEQGFFAETSKFRNGLYAQHRQTQLELFKKKFKEKSTNVITGIISKYKDVDTTVFYNGDQPGVNKYKLMADEINQTIKGLVDVTNDGRDVIDTVFNAIEGYVQNTEDTGEAKRIIKNLPQYIVGGTNSIENIGRIKNKQTQLYDALIKQSEERVSNRNKFEKAQKENTVITTYNFLQEQTKDPNFNVTAWKNTPGRSLEEKQSAERFLQDVNFAGGKDDNPEVIQNIEELLNERNFIEAHTLVSNAYKSGDITLATKNSYHQTRIKNVREFKDNPLFQITTVRNGLKAIEAVIASPTNSGNKIKASEANIYIQDKLGKWIAQNQNDPKYVGKPYDLERDFEIEYNNIISNLRMTGEFGELFGKGEVTGQMRNVTISEGIDRLIQNKQAEKQQNINANKGTKDNKAQSAWDKFMENKKLEFEQKNKGNN